MKKQLFPIVALILIFIFLFSGCGATVTVPTASGSSDAEQSTTPERIVAVSGVSFPARSYTVKVGESIELSASVQPEDATDRSLRYTVGDASVLSYAGGRVTALSEGFSVLIAESADGRFSARCFINVEPADAATSPTVPTTEPPVVSATEPPTVSTTEPPTVSTTEPPTVSTTEPPTVSTTEPPTEPTNVDLEIVTVPGSTVRHLFTHCLIIDPAAGCGYKDAPLDVDCLTVREFRALLQSLYDRGYCLIDINDMYTLDAKGRAKLSDSVRIYKGKKPLVISIDDVTYDPRKKGSGMIDRLVIDAEGNIAGEIDNADGSVTLNYEECFCLLEQFLLTHPDFSFEGSKFTLALTGFVGILGYRTDEQTANAEYRDKYKIKGAPDYLSEREKAKKVVAWFKDHGYNFASHTYSHSDYTNCSLSRVQADIEKWNRNVKPLIGETRVLVYPYGAFTYAGTEKHKALLDEGFMMFCGTSQLNTLWDGSQPKEGGGTAGNTGTIYLERFTVTGFTLRNYASRTNYINYYTDYYKELGSDDATAKQKAEDLASRMYDISHNNSLEYYDPAEIYDHEHRYYKILP